MVSEDKFVPRSLARLRETVSLRCLNVSMPQISKGDRKFLGTRVPEDLGAAIEQRRNALGLSMTDYLLTLLAVDTKMLAYAKTTDCLELPIPAT